MMDKTQSRNKSLVVLLFSFMALATLPACSSDEEEAPPPEESSSSSAGGGGEDCSIYTNQVDIRECEIRNEMIN